MRLLRVFRSKPDGGNPEKVEPGTADEIKLNAHFPEGNSLESGTGAGGE